MGKLMILAACVTTILSTNTNSFAQIVNVIEDIDIK